MKTQVIQTTVIKPAHEVRAMLTFGDDGEVTFKAGAKVTADELAGVVIEDAQAVASQSLRLVNTARLARALPPVKVDKQSVPAFDYVMGKLEDACSSPSTYQNIKGLIECADIRDKNNLQCSPFAIKESLGYLRKAGVLNEETLKLTNGRDSVAKELKGGIGVNKVREVIKKAKDKRPDLFPKGGAKPTPTVETKASEDTAELIALAIGAVIDRMDKLQASGDIEAKRKVYAGKVAQLAKLAGVLK